MSALVAELSAALGAQVTRLERIGGGDISDAYAATVGASTKLFVKTRTEAPRDMYVREAEGLAFLRAARALRVPEVVLADQRFLVLEWIAARGRAPDFDLALGRGLAALHRYGAPRLGLEHDNFIGPLPQDNRASARWSDFYRERRLGPLSARARQQGHLPAALARDLDALLARLDVLVGPEEPPARLHGDLWTGNVHADERGQPVLIDPAVYGGQRELDLAMLRLFGAPSPRFFAAYDEVYPRAEGADERVALYQLYPLLVHVCLFGASYVGQLARAVRSYL